MKAKRPHRLFQIAEGAARKRWVLGWQQLSDDMRDAYVAREVLYVLLAQAMPEYAQAQKLVRDAWGISEQGGAL